MGDGTIGYSLPFVKMGGLFIWDLDIVTKPRLKSLAARCDAAEATTAAPTAPSPAAQAASRDAPAAAAAPCRRSERKAGNEGREGYGHPYNPDAEPATVPGCRKRRQASKAEKEGARARERRSHAFHYSLPASVPQFCYFVNKWRFPSSGELR